jgi:hypothetical protein
MKSSKQNGSAQSDQALEQDIAGNIRALTRTSVAPHRSENGESEMSGDDLAALLRRVSEASTHEIENLIGELHDLRAKLESHGERIQSDITRYAELAQGIMQLTAIISSNVKNLPAAAMSASR